MIEFWYIIHMLEEENERRKQDAGIYGDSDDLPHIFKIIGIALAISSLIIIPLVLMAERDI